MKQVVLITGGTGKVGAQLVLSLTKKDFFVVFIGKTNDEVQRLLEKIPPTKNKFARGIVVDLESTNSPSLIQSFLEQEDMFPECFINAARNPEYLKIEPSGITNRSNWTGEFTIGIMAFYELFMMLVNHKKSLLKNVINISSMYGIVPPNPSLYNNPQLESPIQYGVIKAAQIHLVKELAIRFSKKGIRVNCISYGGIEGRADEAFVQRYALLCPLGRMLKEEEVIGAVDFLLSDGSIGMTGHNLVVDGGWTIW